MRLSAKSYSDKLGTKTPPSRERTNSLNVNRRKTTIKTREKFSKPLGTTRLL